jgi:hypothetical protein
MGQDYLILDAEGRGHYVGTVLAVRTRTASWFGEGDDRFYIDGDAEPTLRGTGTEDYFCDAWGFKEIDRPFYGVVMGKWEDVGAYISVYRWHVNDPVHFQKSLKVTIEHKGVMFNDQGKVISGFMERPDLFSSVAYWYQTGKAKRFATLPPVEERVVSRRVIELEAHRAKVTAEPAQTTVEVQRGRYSGQRQILARFEAEGGVLTVPFSLDQAIQGFARLKLTRAKDYGIWRITLDGKPLPGLDSLDLYAGAVEPAELDIGVVDLTEGQHELRLQCRGKNPASQGYFVGVDALEIEALTPYLLKKK